MTTRDWFQKGAVYFSTHSIKYQTWFYTKTKHLQDGVNNSVFKVIASIRSSPLMTVVCVIRSPIIIVVKLKFVDYDYYYWAWLADE